MKKALLFLVSGFFLHALYLDASIIYLYKKTDQCLDVNGPNPDCLYVNRAGDLIPLGYFKLYKLFHYDHIYVGE